MRYLTTAVTGCEIKSGLKGDRPRGLRTSYNVYTCTAVQCLSVSFLHNFEKDDHSITVLDNRVY